MGRPLVAGYMEDIIPNNIKYHPEGREDAASRTWIIMSAKEESERSYTPALTEKEFKVIIAFLSFQTCWTCMIAICTFLVFFIESYTLLFHNLFSYVAFGWINFILQFLGILDIISNIIHYRWKDISEQKTFRINNKYILMLDGLAGVVLLPTSFGKAILFHYPFPSDIEPYIQLFSIVGRICDVLIVYRMLRITSYIFHLTDTPAKQTVRYVILKYGSFLIIILHCSGCFWRYIGCFYTPEICIANGYNTWTNTVEIAYAEVNHISHYFICIFYIIGTITCNGTASPSNANDVEYIFMIFLMFIGIFVINGLYLGAFTTLQIEEYSRMSTFSNKLGLISQNLTHPNVSKALRQTIIKYYILFWHREGALRKSSLFSNMPRSFQIEVHLDKYWNAINKSYLLRNLHYGLKRAISTVMYTKILNPGEMIVFQESTNASLIYVVRGTVNVLSPDDGESPIVTFSVGSCISEMSLMYNYPSPTALVASSYCVLHCLEKHDLWRMICKYRKLKQLPILYEATSRIVKFAQNANAQVKKFRVKVKPLTRVKEKLISYTKMKERSKASVAFDIYVIREKESIGQTEDTVFLRTTWPWILNPHSQFLLLWEIVITINVVVVSVIYPYVVITTMITSRRIHTLYVYTYMLYVIDLIFKIFTAVEDEIGYHTKVTKIISTRCTDVSFMMDMFSLVPFYLVFAIIDQGAHPQIAYSVSHLNHMLKLYKFFQNINILSNSLNVNVHFLRRVKYVLYLGFAAYISGCAYYMVGCPFSYCYRDDHWINSIKMKKTKYSENDLILKSMYLAMAVLSGTGADVIYVNIYDIAVLIMKHVVFILLFTYLVADYSATLTLNLRSREVFVEMVKAMRMFMKSSNMDPSIHQRMDNYFATQWNYTQGISIQSLMKDCPPALYENQLSAKYYQSYMTIPLFKQIIKNVSIVSKIAAKSEIVFLPPNEYICYAGDISNEMYIVEKGYCEIITPSSGLVERVVGPMSHLCILEMLLNKPRIYNIRTLTDVNLIKITWLDIITELVPHTALYERIKEAIDYIRESQNGKRLFAFRVEFKAVVGKATKSKSFFNFPERKLHPLNIDYLHAWKRYGVARFFLRRHTILPDGDFIYYYSILRGICAFISSLIFPHIFMLQQMWPKYILLSISLILFFSALFDLYIRMHICYYNDDGILVTHPKYTAKHYITSAFIIDMVGMIPLELLFHHLSNFCPTYVMIVLNYNRVLQMYRVKEAFAIFYRDILTGQRLWANIIKFMSITIILITFASSILLIIICDIHYMKGYGFKLQPNEDNWISRYAANKRNDTEINDPTYLLIMSFYFTANYMLQLGFTDITADAGVEVYFAILAIIIGYLWFTYILVIISNSKALLNSNLTMYQNYMKDLITYMNVEKISKDVQVRTIRHFEFIWQRTHGMKHNTIINKCHHALGEDCVLNLYEETINKMPVLIDMEKSFYRRLGMHLTEAYFLPSFTIIQLNDIIDTMYIIHRGEVIVYGPDKSCFAMLGKGSAFGHLDNTSHSRSMTTVIASNIVFLLTIKTAVFYDITKTHPVIHKRLEKHITVVNYSYVQRKHDQKLMQKRSKNFTVKINDNKTLTKTEKILYTSNLQLLYMISYYISFIIQCYQIAFQDTHVTIFIVAYLTDAIHVMKIILGFFTPFPDELGHIITNKRMIRKRYIRSYYLYYDIATVIPIECLSNLVQTKYKWIYLIYLRSNRLLRVTLIDRYLKSTKDYLNAPVITMKLSSVLVYFTLVLHLQTCVWYMVGCPNTSCLKNEWTFRPIIKPSSQNTISERNLYESVCSNHYICALYFSTSITTFTAFSNITARTQLSIFLLTVLAIVLKILISIFIGDITAIVRYIAYTMGNYAHHIQNLKVYLQNGNISNALRQKVISYVGQLWDKSKGHQIPYLLKDAPMHINAAIKLEAYGKYIFENYVFLKCHPDFMRLLITYLEPLTFFTGNYICHNGDINDSMYFIHKGRVEAYLHTEHIDICVDELRDGDCFGMIQGLFPNTPHSHTYIATTVTVILKLELSKWMHLLLFYPATKYEIYEKISNW